jgi:hypothetical protein
MLKLLAALAIFGAASVPAAAQTAATTAAPTAQQATPGQPAQPQMVKKRVCEQIDEDSYSRLGNRKICKTIMVPADQAGSGSKQAPSNSERGN